MKKILIINPCDSCSEIDKNLIPQAPTVLAFPYCCQNNSMIRYSQFVGGLVSYLQ